MSIANQSKSVTILIVIVALIASGLFFIYLLKYTQPKITLINNNQQVDNTSKEPQSIISGWKVYRNKEYEFRIDYPKDWKIEMVDDTLNLISAETSKKIEEQKALFGGEDYGHLTYDITIHYFPTILSRFNNGDTNLMTLNELIESDITMKKLRETNINDVNTIEMEFYGENIYYGLLIEKNEHLYEIIFNNISNKEALTSIEKQILSTFQLTE